MSGLMRLCGLVLALAGVVLAVLTFQMPGQMDVYGIKLDTAAILFVGGIFALGLGGIIDAVRQAAPRRVIETVGEAQRAAVVAEPSEEKAPDYIVRKGAETVTVATAAVATEAKAGAAAAAKPDPVAETIDALEKAKADVIKSIGGMDDIDTPAAETKSEQAKSGKTSEPAEDEDVATDEDGEGLYVVEERVIRGRPARVLSDDTIEAETDEGWMRFENLDHLNEYLDSVEEQLSEAGPQAQPQR